MQLTAKDISPLLNIPFCRNYFGAVESERSFSNSFFSNNAMKVGGDLIEA
jgi:hypothetical protein